MLTLYVYCITEFLDSEEDPVSNAAIQDQVDILDDIPADIYCDLVETLNEKCLETSLLEIWKYNEEQIRGKNIVFYTK